MVLDFSDNKWIETEKIKHLGICNNKQVRDESRVSIDQYDIIKNSTDEMSAQDLIDLGDLE